MHPARLDALLKDIEEAAEEVRDTLDDASNALADNKLNELIDLIAELRREADDYEEMDG